MMILVEKFGSKNLRLKYVFLFLDSNINFGGKRIINILGKCRLERFCKWLLWLLQTETAQRA